MLLIIRANQSPPPAVHKVKTKFAKLWIPFYATDRQQQQVATFFHDCFAQWAGHSEKLNLSYIDISCTKGLYLSVSYILSGP